MAETEMTTAAPSPDLSAAHATRDQTLPSGIHSVRARYEAAVWGMLVAFGLAFGLAALLGVPSPLEPLSELIMQLTPVTLASVLIEHLGPVGGFAALLGALALCLPVAGALGVLAPPTDLLPPGGLAAAVRSLWAPRWALVAVASLLAVVPLTLAASSAGAAWSALVAGVLLPPALWLTRRMRARLVRSTGNGWRRAAPETTAAPESERADISRRRLLMESAATGINMVGLIALGSYDGWSRVVGAALGRAETLRQLFRYSPPASRVAGFPVAGEEPEVTPAAQFYRVSKNAADPIIPADEWRLSISGAVHSPLTLGYTQVLALPRVNQYVTLRCVDNQPSSHLMSNAYWSGVALSTVLAQAGAQPGVVAVRLQAPDGYAEVVPLAAALAPGAMLAYGMNGATLARAHGGPVRALVPGYFGFKNVKWIEGIDLLTDTAPDYWSQRGWTAAQIHSIARIDVWHAAPGGLLIGGVAFGGARGVSAVQVQADDGAWQAADLHTPPLSPVAWVQWRITLPLTPGSHTLTARMLDGAGLAQDARQSHIYPGGATGLHSVSVML